MFRICIIAVLTCCTVAEAAVPVRIKDMARLQLGQEIQLTGMGLIIGLEGTGDGRQASFTLRMLANMMNRMNVKVDPNQIRVRNVASVSATAILSPYHHKGSRIDVQVASLGDAASLVREFQGRKTYETREDTSTRPVWDTVWSLLLVLAVLGLEWLLRKRARLI